MDATLVAENYKIYESEGRWFYQPHDFDGSFEVWCEPTGYESREAAEVAAARELAEGPHAEPAE